MQTRYDDTQKQRNAEGGAGGLSSNGRGGGSGRPLPHGEGEDAHGAGGRLPQLDHFLHIFVLLQRHEIRQAIHVQPRAQRQRVAALALPVAEELGAGGGGAQAAEYAGPPRREREGAPHVARACIVCPPK